MQEFSCEKVLVFSLVLMHLTFVFVNSFTSIDHLDICPQLLLLPRFLNGASRRQQMPMDIIHTTTRYGTVRFARLCLIIKLPYL